MQSGGSSFGSQKAPRGSDRGRWLTQQSRKGKASKGWCVLQVSACA